jgi:hypothetical protein
MVDEGNSLMLAFAGRRLSESYGLCLEIHSWSKLIK